MISDNVFTKIMDYLFYYSYRYYKSIKEDDPILSSALYFMLVLTPAVAPITVFIFKDLLDIWDAFYKICWIVPISITLISYYQCKKRKEYVFKKYKGCTPLKGLKKFMMLTLPGWVLVIGMVCYFLISKNIIEANGLTGCLKWW